MSARSDATATPPITAWNTRWMPVVLPWTRSRPPAEATRWNPLVLGVLGRPRLAIPSGPGQSTPAGAFRRRAEEDGAVVSCGPSGCRAQPGPDHRRPDLRHDPLRKQRAPIVRATAITPKPHPNNGSARHPPVMFFRAMRCATSQATAAAMLSPHARATATRPLRRPQRRLIPSLRQHRYSSPPICYPRTCQVRWPRRAGRASAV